MVRLQNMHRVGGEVGEATRNWADTDDLPAGNVLALCSSLLSLLSHRRLTPIAECARGDHAVIERTGT